MDTMRICTKCKREGPECGFYRYGKRFKSWCKDCQKADHAAWKRRRREHVNEYARRWSMEYGKTKEGRAKIKNWSLKARDKKSVWLAKIKLEDPEKYKRFKLHKHMRRRFGVGIEIYDFLLKKQENRCAMCKKYPESGTRLQIDHDHKTGEVRGLLCGPCNCTVHYVEEHAWRIKLGRKYLEQFSEAGSVSQVRLPLGYAWGADEMREMQEPVLESTEATD